MYFVTQYGIGPDRLYRYVFSSDLLASFGLVALCSSPRSPQHKGGDISLFNVFTYGEPFSSLIFKSTGVHFDAS